MISSWTNAPEEVTDDMVGFIYIIQNKTTGKFYIGQKKYWSVTRRPPLKGKKRKRIVKKQNWENYVGSNPQLKEEAKAGHDLEKIILCDCTSKWLLNLVETWAQIHYDCAMREDCYNCIVNLRQSLPPKGLTVQMVRAKKDTVMGVLDKMLL